MTRSTQLLLQRVIILAASACFSCFILSGEEAEAPLFSASTSLVLLDVSVLDEDQRPVVGLGAEQFQILEDGQPVKVASFSVEDIPISIAFVLDSSSSMLGRGDLVEASLRAFLKASNPYDETSVVSFSDEVYLDLPFTENVTRVHRALLRPAYRGQSRLADAVLTTIPYIKTNTAKERAVIVVVTDGDDNCSESSVEKIVRMVSSGAHGIPIYVIGFPPKTPTRRSRRAAVQLRQLADATGGRSAFPTTSSEAAAMATSFASEIRQQYTLAYEPSTRGTGERSLEVSVTSSLANSVHHRQSYVLTEEMKALLDQ